VWDAPGGPILVSADFRHIWGQFSRKYGLPDPAPAGASVAEKSALRHEAVQRYFRGLPDRATLIGQLDSLNIAWGSVLRSEDIREQPTARHRGAIIEIDDRAGGTRPVVQSPYRFSDAESGLRRPAPHKGEHNAEVLAEWLGLDEAAREEWADVLRR
jgi:crotonobetainyl-CoA:carnitine CoA-transferase CaiB-like acyl-CoA transferase